MGGQSILLTALMFFVLVAVHEWGHFYFAKRAGVLVHEFAIGFGPKVFSFLKGETRYTLRLLPFGGFVKMAGESGADEQDVPLNRQFATKTVAQRALSIFAGPMMNFILAFILFFSFAYLIGVPAGKATHTEIGSVIKDSPAEQAGLNKGDIIVAVNGDKIGTDVDKLISYIQKSTNQSLQWEIKRDNTIQTISVTPKDTDGKGAVGVSILLPQPTKAPSIIKATQMAANSFVEGTKQIFIGFKMLVTLQFKLDDLGGPIRITEYTSQAIQSGFSTYVFWTAILSLYLGLFNLLPIPALDGSRLVFLLLEALRGKPIEQGKENIVHFIGFALMMVLMITVTFNDIVRLIKG